MTPGALNQHLVAMVSQALGPGLPSGESQLDPTLLAAAHSLHLEGPCLLGVHQEGRREGRDCCPPPA